MILSTGADIKGKSQSRLEQRCSRNNTKNIHKNIRFGSCKETKSAPLPLIFYFDAMAFPFATFRLGIRELHSMRRNLLSIIAGNSGPKNIVGIYGFISALGFSNCPIPQAANCAKALRPDAEK